MKIINGEFVLNLPEMMRLMLMADCAEAVYLKTGYYDDKPACAEFDGKLLNMIRSQINNK